MFRNFALRKALRTVVLLAVLAAAAYFIRQYVADTADIGIPAGGEDDGGQRTVSNDRLERVTGNGMTKVAENGRLALSIDLATGNIEVTDKNGGGVWSSRPSPEQIERDTSNNLWKNNMQSPILVEYVKSYTETVPSYANAFSPNTVVNVYRLDDGARVHYEFQDFGIKIAVDYRLRDDHLEVSVPHELIEEPETVYVTNDKGRRVIDGKSFRKIVGYSVLPFFGAVQEGEAPAGYMMVPDGPGGLIRFDGNKRHRLSYSGKVYGADLSFMNHFDSSLSSGMEEAVVHYPVFGLNRGDRSMLAVIHSGESGAEIVAAPAGVNTSFHHVYARFPYREKYKKLTDLTGAGVYLYTDFSINVSRTMKYYFLHGADVGYAGMAAVYREYLRKEKGLEAQSAPRTDMPLELRIVGGMKEDGFLTDPFVAMTTFEQAEDMLDYFYDNGVRGLNVVYEGWAKGGDSVKYPDRFPVESRLGGESGLKRLAERAHQYGYKLFLEDDNMRAMTGRGVSERNDVVRDILNTPLDLGDGGRREHVLNTAAIRRIIGENLPKYRELGIDGIHEKGLDRLNTDFHASHPMNREQVKRQYRELISEMVDKIGAVRVDGGLAFHMMAGVSVYNPADDYSFSPIVDEIVPFYPMALHGLADLVSVPFNRMDEPEREALKAVEYGMNVSFTVTAEPTERLQHADTDLYSTEFDVWKSEILRLYRKINDALGSVAGAAMIGHERIGRDVYKAVYDNGVEIVCNYSEAPFHYRGESVAPMDFAAFRGGDQHAQAEN